MICQETEKGKSIPVVKLGANDLFGKMVLFDRETDHIHLRINHQEAFAIGDVHTNNIESFWATLKRGILGIYHHVSVEYLQNYINEFCFRYNHRVHPNLANPKMFDLVLKQAVLI